MSNAEEFLDDMDDEDEYDYDLEFGSNIDCVSNYISSNQQTVITDACKINDIDLSNDTSVSAPKKRKNVDHVIAGLMGQANMSFASGDYDTAITTCMEVIRNSPNFPEPFLTLATIYDEKGEVEKSLQFSLIGAHLAKDINIWLQVSEKYFEAGKKDIGLNCFEKACRCPESDASLWKKLLGYLSDLEVDKRKILETQRHYMDALKPCDGDIFMPMARTIFKGYHEIGADDKALDAMVSAIAKHPNLIDTSDINLLLDFYISKNAFNETLTILVEQCGVELLEEEKESVQVPENTPIDLVAKLCICLIRLKRIDAANSAMKIILEHDVNVIGDIYLEIAESLLLENYYSEAEPLFKQLVLTKQFNQAEVWLRYAECLSSLQKLQDAADAYQHVMQLAPNHIDVRIALSLIYQRLNMLDQAIEVLCQAGKLKADECADDFDTSPKELDLRNTSMKLVSSLCSVLLSHGREEKYILIASSLILFLSKNLVASKKNLAQRWIKNLSRFSFVSNYKISVNTEVRFDMDFKATGQELWVLYRQLFDVLYKRKDFKLLNDVTLMMSILPQYHYQVSFHEELEFLICLTSFFIKNYFLAHQYLRIVLLRNIDNESKNVSRIWNLFSIILNHEIRVNSTRFCIRLAMKHQMNTQLCTFNGHSALFTGSYRHALAEYFTCLQLQPANPLYHLMIGITLIHISNHKYEKSKLNIITQAFIFFNQYLDLRGECQESLYNLGRAMHQFHLYPAAISFYERALNCQPIRVSVCCPACPTHCPLKNAGEDNLSQSTPKYTNEAIPIINYNDEAIPIINLDNEAIPNITDASKQSSANHDGRNIALDGIDSLRCASEAYHAIGCDTSPSNDKSNDDVLLSHIPCATTSSIINNINTENVVSQKQNFTICNFNSVNDYSDRDNSKYCNKHCPLDCPLKPDEIIEYASLDLTKEIAYNLYALYINCHSFEMAMYIVQNYLTF